MQSRLRRVLQILLLSSSLWEVRTMRDASLATVPTLLGYEKATNPFLRWDVPAVQEAKAVGRLAFCKQVLGSAALPRRQLADSREQLMSLRLYESGRSRSQQSQAAKRPSHAGHWYQTQNGSAALSVVMSRRGYIEG